MDRNAATEKRERIMDGATLINRGGSPFVSNKDALVEGLIFRTNREYQICQAARDLSSLSLFLSSCWSKRQATKIMMHDRFEKNILSSPIFSLGFHATLDLHVSRTDISHRFFLLSGGCNVRLMFPRLWAPFGNPTEVTSLPPLPKSHSGTDRFLISIFFIFLKRFVEEN